jgi:hypothetical protein
MTMDERLQAYLDGEASLDDLPADLRARARAWDDLVVEMRAGGPAGAPAGLETRVRAAVREFRSRRVAPVRWLTWVLRPRPIRVSPLAAAAAAIVLLAVAVRPWAPAASDATAGRVYVQFVVQAPGARTVQLAGDFSGWEPSATLTDPDGDGVWTGRVALEPGVHEYMFVVDGSDWVPDPNAAAYSDDGFGRRNSVVAVAPLNGT